MKNKALRRLVLSALLLALGMVLPLLTMQIKEIGDSLLPMHIPVMLCGLICGAKYGSAVGFMLPFLRSIIFGMPPLYPNAIWMSLELLTYGLVIGILYSNSKKRLRSVYFSLVVAMILGRVVWGASKAILLGATNNVFTMRAFLIGGVFDALPGIILQLILIPALMTLIKTEKTKNIYKRKEGAK